MTEALPPLVDPILIVEDDIGTALLEKNCLSEAGWDSEVVTTGQAAIQWLAGHKPPLMLLDNGLPDMTGEELAGMPGQALPPFIVTTGAGSERLAVALMKLGARDYLVKDATFLQSLHPAVARVLKQLETERKLAEAEAALRESEKRFRGLLQGVDFLAVQGYAPDGTTLYWNEASERLYGYSAEEAIGRNLLDLIIPPEMRKEVEQAVQRITETGRAIPSSELSLRKKDGSRVSVLSNHAIVRVPGRPPELFCMDIDLTGRKQLEEQLHQSQKMESLGVLAGGVAHDMNNVMGAIMALASLHQMKSPEGTPLHRDMETIVKACQRAGSLVKGLLGFARRELAEERGLDLNALVREEVAILERTTLQKIRLEMDLAENLLPLMGDPATLSHALMNLCVNAVDAMPDGGTLTLRTRNGEEGTVFLEVADTGRGMAKEVLDKALDPFFTTKPQGQGTGLGLTMVYGTVQAHHGTLEIRSEPGQGTRVLIWFPAHGSLPEKPDPPADALSKRPQKSLHVLLVDDDDLIQSSVEPLLEVMGHRVTVASSGEEALARLEQGLDPDLVILDMNMPGLGGAGTLPRLRAMRPAVPILLATGRADQKAQELVAAHPLVTLLSKPFALSDLQHHLEAAIEGVNCQED